jgi:hypothetical protein
MRRRTKSYLCESTYNRAIYGSALLWYKKFRYELEQEGFIFNPYNPCVANRMKKGLQQTILFHVDDLKPSSHKDPKVNDEFEKWLQANYGQHGKGSGKPSPCKDPQVPRHED